MPPDAPEPWDRQRLLLISTDGHAGPPLPGSRSVVELAEDDRSGRPSHPKGFVGPKTENGLRDVPVHAVIALIIEPLAKEGAGEQLAFREADRAGLAREVDRPRARPAHARTRHEAAGTGRPLAARCPLVAWSPRFGNR